MKAYLDTSVLLRKLFGEPEALRGWGGWREGFASDLIRVEGRRAIERLRLRSELDDEEVAAARAAFEELVGGVSLIAATPRVLERASESFPTEIGALDALHLASALLYQEIRNERLAFLTHDRRQGLAARALGFETRGWE